MLRYFQRTGRGKVLRWTINGRQPSSRTSWTLPEHQLGINGKQTGRLLNSPSSMDHRNHANLRHRRRQRRKLELLPSCRDSVARFWNLSEEAHSTHTRYIVFCFTFDIIGPLVISLCHPDLGCKSVRASITIQTAPSSPTLHRLSVPSLPIPCQIALGFLPPLYNLLTALSPVKSCRQWIQAFFSEYVHDVLEFRAPGLICSFLGREREEQGLSRVERDLSVKWCPRA